MEVNRRRDVEQERIYRLARVLAAALADYAIREMAEKRISDASERRQSESGHELPRAA